MVEAGRTRELRGAKLLLRVGLSCPGVLDELWHAERSGNGTFFYRLKRDLHARHFFLKRLHRHVEPVFLFG